jgi:hypothetical protein
MKASLLTATVFVLTQAITSIGFAQSDITQAINQAQGFVTINNPIYNGVPFLAFSSDESRNAEFQNRGNDNVNKERTRIAVARAREICKLLGHGEPVGVRFEYIETTYSSTLGFILNGAVVSHSIPVNHYYNAKLAALSCKRSTIVRSTTTESLEIRQTEVQQQQTELNSLNP